MIKRNSATKYFAIRGRENAQNTDTNIDGRELRQCKTNVNERNERYVALTYLILVCVCVCKCKEVKNE